MVRLFVQCVAVGLLLTFLFRGKRAWPKVPRRLSILRLDMQALHSGYRGLVEVQEPSMPCRPNGHGISIATTVTPAKRQARAVEIFQANANALIAKKMDARTRMDMANKLGSSPDEVITLDDLSEAEVNRLWRITRKKP